MKISKIGNEIYKLSSNLNGPRVGLFAGVHGDETTGVLALRQLMPKLELVCGTVFVVFANPPAIKKNKRLIIKNLNRCFVAGNNGETYEDRRAKELMKVMDDCEAVLDLHSFKDETGKPFVICEENGFDIATKLDVDIISTNWTKTEPGGTDGYMYSQGKVGICVECGPISQTKQYQDFTLKTVNQFLKYFDVIHSSVEFSAQFKRIIRTDKAIIRRSKDFKLAHVFYNFQELKSGQDIGSQDGERYVARKGDYIIFPNPEAEMGSEAFTIGYEV